MYVFEAPPGYNVQLILKSIDNKGSSAKGCWQGVISLHDGPDASAPAIDADTCEHMATSTGRFLTLYEHRSLFGNKRQFSVEYERVREDYSGVLSFRCFPCLCGHT